jgi:hypothetical protein
MTAAGKRPRHPMRGAVYGLVFGVLVAIDLLLLGVVPTNSAVLIVLPLLGLAAGLTLGLTTPFRRATRGRTAPS